MVSFNSLRTIATAVLVLFMPFATPRIFAAGPHSFDFTQDGRIARAST